MLIEETKYSNSYGQSVKSIGQMYWSMLIKLAPFMDDGEEPAVSYNHEHDRHK